MAESQEITAQSLMDMSLEDLMNIEIVTASKTLEKVSEAPATVIVITRQEIRDRGYANLKDVFRDLPGMETIEHYFSEIGTLVPVRGLVGNNKIVILVNGMRVNPPGGEEFPLRSDFSVRYAERIEVIYGPGSTLYGQDAISMIVNVITVEPGNDFNAEVMGIGGTEDHREGYFSLSDSINTKAGPLKISGYLQCQDTDLEDFSESQKGWWSYYDTVAQPIGDGRTAKRWDKGLNAFVKFETENASLQAWHRDSSRSSAEGAYTPILFFVDEAIWHDRSTVVEGKHNLELSDTSNIESILTFNRYEIDPETRYVWPASSTSFFFDDYKYGVGTNYTLEERLTHVFSERFSGIVGLVATHNDIIPKATIPGGANRDGDIVSQAGYFTYYTIQGDPNSRVDLAKAHNLTYQNFGIYLEGRYQATDKLKLIAGIRADTDTRYDQKPISPRLAVIYHVSDHLTCKYTYTEAYVAPAPYYGYNIYAHSTALNIANPNLKPEEVSSHEINLSYTRENLTCGAALYLNRQKNIILLGDTAPAIGQVWLDEAGTISRLLTQSTNAGKSKAQGIDLFFKYRLEPFLLWGSYSYVDFANTLMGNTTGLPGISNNNIRLGTTYNISRKLTATASLAWRSTPENITNTFGLGDELKDPYDVDLFVNYDMNKHSRLFLGIQNLTNHNYALKGMISPVPQDGIKIVAGAAVRYK